MWVFRKADNIYNILNTRRKSGMKNEHEVDTDVDGKIAYESG